MINGKLRYGGVYDAVIGYKGKPVKVKYFGRLERRGLSKRNVILGFRKINDWNIGEIFAYRFSDEDFKFDDFGRLNIVYADKYELKKIEDRYLHWLADKQGISIEELITGKPNLIASSGVAA
ncbi:hypothetical protein J4407_00295 [Candidatus Pacearchaeota archaeon]|nr:hypothetical protein [Candidatus Pacearchaeota archaeon]